MAIGATDINTEPGCSRAIDPDIALSRSFDLDITMDLGGSADLLVQHGLCRGATQRCQHSHSCEPILWIFIGPSVVIGATNMNM